MSHGSRRFRLLAVWLLLVLLVGAILLIEHTDLVRPQRHSDDHSSAAARLLLPVPVDQLGAIEIAYAGALYRFERDAAGAWFYHTHSVDTGSAESHRHDQQPSVAAHIESALAAFGRTRLERQFPLTTQAQDYGIMRPEILILVYRPDDTQPLARYAIGDVAPDTLSRYVQVVGSTDVATIPNYQIDNVLALIQAITGKAPPEQAPQRLP